MRVLVIGLDCVPPSLVFDRWAEHLPHLTALRARALWGTLRSCLPPITVPAWTCMVSGRDPGELGIYGFRNRADGYALRVATSHDVRCKRVWDRLGESGYSVAPLFVPLTSPPTPVRGRMVSCFLTPNVQAPYTFPRAWKEELETDLGPYRMDVEGFRKGELDRIVDDLYTMTRQHFAMARHTWTKHRPDFLMMVEMGPDRLHHALWHHLDPKHRRYVPGNRWEEEARAYYAALDAEVGELLSVVDDDTVVIVASDHGAQSMEGAIAINEWLIQEGWLTLRTTPTEPTPLREVVDWSKTRVWGEGGYYARLFLNVEGREPEGVVPPGDVDTIRNALTDALEEWGPAGTQVHRPEDVYKSVRGNPPDLMAVFGDLTHRSVGTVGHGQVLLDTDGEDGCNHAWDGIFMMAGPGVDAKGPVSAEIYDVGRTILGLFDVPAGESWRGRDWSKTT
ncbi:MAG: alkaline phosphatase family protein [Myxococcota bacterium]